MKSYILNRLRSFVHAFHGLVDFFRGEAPALLHALAMMVAIGAGWWLGISRVEWLVILLTIAILVAAELLNSAVESLADAVTKEYHPLIKKAKDFAAAAVLVLSLAAIAVAVIVYGPYIVALF